MLKLLQGGKQDRVRPEVRRDHPDQAAIAHRLTLARELQGLTMRGAVRVSGIPYRTIEMAEAGTYLDGDDLKVLCSRYEVSVDWVLGKVPEQADLSELDEPIRRYAESLPPEERFRVLTILAFNAEVACG